MVKKLIWFSTIITTVLVVSTVKLVPAADIRQTQEGVKLRDLDRKTEFRQTFIPHQEWINGVAVAFGTFFNKDLTYMRTNKGEVTFTLVSAKLPPNKSKLKNDRKEEELVAITLPVKQIENYRERLYFFWFPPQKVLKNHNYLVKLRSTSASGKAITCIASKKDIYRDGALLINGVRQNNDLVFQTYYSSSLLEIFTKMLDKHSFYEALLLPITILLLIPVFLGLVISILIKTNKLNWL